MDFQNPHESKAIKKHEAIKMHARVLSKLMLNCTQVENDLTQILQPGILIFHLMSYFRFRIKIYYLFNFSVVFVVVS